MSKQTKDDIIEDCKFLESIFQDMIVDLHEWKGMCQARIAYIYYREQIQNIQEKIKKL